VDNAIRHGIARSSTAGRITVSGARRGEWLEIVVTDDGPGITGPTLAVRDHVGGVGLDVTRARLRQAYGAASTVTLNSAPTGGTVATVRLPYRTPRPEATHV
jgi:LytS/YehU family sensor histidine kinase